MARTRSVLAVVATAVMSLALARLVDAVGKRALADVAREVESERAAAEAECESIVGLRSQLELDQRLLEHRIAAMSKREHHLVISRSTRRVQLAMGDKVMLETGYRLRGSTDGITGFLSIPKATIQVLGKRKKTDWCRPNWLYQLEGLNPPEDSALRVVPNAFGPGEVFLGGGISIHGPVRDEVPAEAIDHIYLELSDKWVRALVDALEPGALVFIE